MVMVLLPFLFPLPRLPLSVLSHIFSNRKNQALFIAFGCLICLARKVSQPFFLFHDFDILEESKFSCRILHVLDFSDSFLSVEINLVKVLHK